MIQFYWHLNPNPNDLVTGAGGAGKPWIYFERGKWHKIETYVRTNTLGSGQRRVQGVVERRPRHAHQRPQARPELGARHEPVAQPVLPRWPIRARHETDDVPRTRRLRRRAVVDVLTLRLGAAFAAFPLDTLGVSLVRVDGFVDVRVGLGVRIIAHRHSVYPNTQRI